MQIYKCDLCPRTFENKNEFKVNGRTFFLIERLILDAKKGQVRPKGYRWKRKALDLCPHCLAAIQEAIFNLIHNPKKAKAEVNK